jgi:hypothetical protein
MPAYQAAGRGILRPPKGDDWPNYYEWNHIVADCLGGKTEAKNLVAASASCNTFMMNIEACLKGKGHIQIDVRAYCKPKKADVAEWITYDIINQFANNPLSYVIDGRAKYFTRDDGRYVITGVKKYVG